MIHKFVKFIPDLLEDNIIYISLDYGTVVHKCCCGCGNEVVTPLSPTDWKVIFDGASISLYPSIGNWNFKCKSHYWIRNNKIYWAEQWSDDRINQNRLWDQIEKKKYYNDRANRSAFEKDEVAKSSFDKFFKKLFIWFD